MVKRLVIQGIGSENFEFQTNMKMRLKISIFLAAMCLWLGCAQNLRAFALLGPVQPWMQTTNGVIFPDDIGGPMCISNGYRWNVPVVIYGFDKSFLDYFGTNGVAAVESAIQILNNLPPASQIVLTNYPLDSQPVNYVARAQSFYDLKSETLSLLLEHLGLAQPTRNTFVLKQWTPAFIASSSENDWYVWAVPDYIVQRNFDPQTVEASPYVNEALYSAYVGSNGIRNWIITFPVDPFDDYTAVAGFNLSSGYFYTGLTYDDVGGLSYLLSTNNVNYETLLSGVVGAGTNVNSFRNGAWRPGVDKITFLPQPVDPQSGAFLPTTNYFTDRYITNGILQQQQVARIISQPDFLFSAGDVTSGSAELPFYSRTGTTNWLNNATANGNINGAGPGVIQPQVQIVFNKLGPLLYSGDGTSDEQVFVDSLQYWGSFDGSTNVLVIYPIPQTGTNQMTVRMWLSFGTQFQKSFEWKPGSFPGEQFAMQTSTNLVNWTTLFTVTNNSSVCTYFNEGPTSPNRFYRLVPH